MSSNVDNVIYIDSASIDIANIDRAYINTASFVNVIQGTASIALNSLFASSSAYSTQSLNSTSSITSKFSTQSLFSTSSLTSVWASASLSASYVPNLYPQIYQVSGSWASASLSASYLSNTNIIISGSNTIKMVSNNPLLVISNLGEVGQFIGDNQYAGFRVASTHTTNGVPYIALNDSASNDGSNLGIQKAYLAYWGSASAYASVGGISNDAICWKTEGPTMGNVGIGTNAPKNKLDIIGNISCSVVTASLFNGTASNAISASYVPNLYPVTTVTSASWASASLSSSFSQKAISSSYADRFSINTNSSSAARLQIFGDTAVATPAIRLNYNDGNWFDFKTTPEGNLSLNPHGTSQLTVNGFLTESAVNIRSAFHGLQVYGGDNSSQPIVGVVSNGSPLPAPVLTLRKYNNTGFPKINDGCGILFQQSYAGTGSINWYNFQTIGFITANMEDTGSTQTYLSSDRSSQLQFFTLTNGQGSVTKKMTLDSTGSLIVPNRIVSPLLLGTASYASTASYGNNFQANGLVVNATSDITLTGSGNINLHGSTDYDTTAKSIDVTGVITNNTNGLIEFCASDGANFKITEADRTSPHFEVDINAGRGVGIGMSAASETNTNQIRFGKVGGIEFGRFDKSGSLCLNTTASVSGSKLSVSGSIYHAPSGSIFHKVPISKAGHTFMSGTDTTTVLFANAMPDTNYVVYISAPATGGFAITYINPTINGFTASYSGTGFYADWIAMQITD